MRDSFIFYRSFKESISDLSDSDKLVIYEAICDFSLDLKEPNLEGFPKALFKLMRPILEANIQRWRNGCNGGAPKGNKNAVKQKVTDIKQPKRNRKTTEKQANKDKDVDKDKDVNVNNEYMSTAKACTHTLEGGEVYTQYVSWLKDNAPYIFGHYTNLVTEAQLTKLQETYPLKKIIETIMQIENRQDLRKKYTNLYMTLRNWLKKEVANEKR